MACPRDRSLPGPLHLTVLLFLPFFFFFKLQKKYIIIHDHGKSTTPNNIRLNGKTFLHPLLAPLTYYPLNVIAALFRPGFSVSPRDCFCTERVSPFPLKYFHNWCILRKYKVICIFDMLLFYLAFNMLRTQSSLNLPPPPHPL